MGVVNSHTIGEYKDELNLFLTYIHNSANKINNNLINSSKEKKVFSYTTTNFKFYYTIYSDKSSEFEFNLIKSSKKHFAPSFLNRRTMVMVGYVYFIKSEYGYKIGKTKNISVRMSDFSIMLPFKFEIHSTVKCKEFNELEVILHKSLSHKRLNGEWFQLSDCDFTEIDIIIKNMGLKRNLFINENKN